MRAKAWIFAVSALAASFVLAAPGRSQDARTAPPLRVAQWVKGDPVPKFEPGKVYLIEFWAVWCGQCIANIPHLNALQKKYAKDGLVIIGFTTPDVAVGGAAGRKEYNTLQLVTDFVAEKGDRMNYRVAYDTPDKGTYKQYVSMIAEPGIVGAIPWAFLIDRDGKLVFSQLPFYMEDPIREVLAGTWDQKKGIQRFKDSVKLHRDALAAENYTAFSAAFSALQHEFPDMAERCLDEKLQWAIKAGDGNAAAAAAAEITASARKNDDPAILVAAVDSSARQHPVGETPGLLVRMADAALELSGAGDSAALAARAEASFASGDAKTAVDFQTRALKGLAGSSAAKARARLDVFSAALKPSPKN